MEHLTEMKICGELDIKTPKTTKNGKPYYMIKLKVVLERATYYFPFFIFGDTNVAIIDNAEVGSDIRIECPMKNNSYNDRNGNKVNKDFDANAFEMKIFVDKLPVNKSADESSDDDESDDSDSLPF